MVGGELCDERIRKSYGSTTFRAGGEKREAKEDGEERE
jgi:hypothetical protein